MIKVNMNYFKIKTLDLNKLEQEYKVAEKSTIFYLDEADLGTKQNWLVC